MSQVIVQGRAAGHATWLSRQSYPGYTVVVRLVDWEAVRRDARRDAEEETPRYQVSLTAVPAELLGEARVQATTAAPARHSAADWESSEELALGLVDAGLGQLLWVKEGNDAGWLVRRAETWLGEAGRLVRSA